MSTQDKEIPNPPAFPVEFDPHFHSKGNFTVEEQEALTLGMSLRDYFAAKAIQTPVSFQPSSIWQWIKWACGLPYNSNSRSHKANASEAYRLADAMLKERSKH